MLRKVVNFNVICYYSSLCGFINKTRLVTSVIRCTLSDSVERVEFFSSAYKKDLCLRFPDGKTSWVGDLTSHVSPKRYLRTEKAKFFSVLPQKPKIVEM